MIVFRSQGYGHRRPLGKPRMAGRNKTLAVYEVSCRVRAKSCSRSLATPFTPIQDGSPVPGLRRDSTLGSSAIHGYTPLFADEVLARTRCCCCWGSPFRIEQNNNPRSRVGHDQGLPRQVDDSSTGRAQGSVRSLPPRAQPSPSISHIAARRVRNPLLALQGEGRPSRAGVRVGPTKSPGLASSRRPLRA